MLHKYQMLSRPTLYMNGVLRAPVRCILCGVEITVTYQHDEVETAKQAHQKEDCTEFLPSAFISLWGDQECSKKRFR